MAMTMRRARLCPRSVAQSCTLPYRRIAFCEPPTVRALWDISTLCRFQIGDTAECNSALRECEISELKSRPRLRGSSNGWRFLCLGFVLLASQSLFAFVLNLDGSGATRHWELSASNAAVHTNVVNPTTKAIRYFVASETYSSTNATAELEAVRAAFDQWLSVPGTRLRFEEGGLVSGGADVNTSDQTNLIFWAKRSTFVNGDRDNISGSLAVTYPRLLENNVLAEADIVLNGVEFAWFADFKSTNNTDRFVESVVLHEIGHFLGFDHSPVGGATLFPRGLAGINAQAGLSSDDIAAVRTLYSAPGASAAWAFLRGRATIDALGVFGAAVVAEDSAGNIASGSITDVNGSFELPSLPPGRYLVRVTPLDAPSNNSLTRLISGNDIAPAFSSADSNFLPSTNQTVLLTAGQTNVVNFSLTRGSPAFRITRIQPTAKPEDRFVAINAPAIIAPGQSNLVVGVYSPNFPDAGALLKVTGDGLVIGPSQLVTDAFPGSNPSLRRLSIPISVAPDATPGLRSFVVLQSTNVAYANGFLEILPPFSDFNFDRLDDNFQRQYFSRFTSPSAGPSADPDGDGFVNLSEYLAGTNPTNALSLLKIDQVIVTSSVTSIAWQSVPGRRYQVFSRSLLDPGPWLPLGDVVLATRVQTVFSDTTATNGLRFYRVLVLP
jgi:hypothetical protein